MCQHTTLSLPLHPIAFPQQPNMLLPGLLVVGINDSHIIREGELNAQ